MIDERSLARAMKESWRGGGYEVAGYGDGNGRMLFLDGRTWAALLPRRTCPRKVLALLAEHLGEIPEASAYRVSKNTGAQNQMMDMPLGTLDKLQREVAEGKGEEILRTNMVWKGREVWQKENLRVLAFDAALTEIGFGEPLAYGNMLVWDDEGGMVFILPDRRNTGAAAGADAAGIRGGQATCTGSAGNAASGGRWSGTTSSRAWPTERNRRNSGWSCCCVGRSATGTAGRPPTAAARRRCGCTGGGSGSSWRSRTRRRRTSGGCSERAICKEEEL